MRRVAVLMSVVAVMGLVAGSPRLRTVAKDTIPTVTPFPDSDAVPSEAEPMATHPIVGSWSERRNAGSRITFFADGNVIMTDGEGLTWHGAWQPVAGEDIIATYVLEAWGPGGGRGIEGFVISVFGDRLFLGDGSYVRLIPPSADSFLPVGTPAVDVAVGRRVETVVLVDPSECVVEPRTVDEVRFLALNAASAEDTVIDDEADLPWGEAASPRLVAAVVAFERQYAACLNANDWPRGLALMTDEWLARSVRPDDVDELFGLVDPPFVVYPQEPRTIDSDLTIDAVVVRDVRVLPDGRVGAIVRWGYEAGVGLPAGYRTPTTSWRENLFFEANFHVYENVEGRWLLDEEISGL